MLLFLLLRRLSPRTATVVGVVLVAVGLALIAMSAVLSAGLLVHGIALVVVGAVVGASAVVNRRRASAATPVSADPSVAGRG
jgi:drug/metabolite transporter (DMT)-like permease